MEKGHTKALSNQPQTKLVPYHRQWAPQKWKKQPKKRGRWHRRWLVPCCLLILIATLLLSQGNGEIGALVADTFRATFGPTITARVESWYLGLSDTAHQLHYQLNGKHVASPWTVTPTSRPTTSPSSATPTAPTILPMSLTSIPPIITPSIPGEGNWAVQEMAPPPHPNLPVVAKAIIRPDPSLCSCNAPTI